MIRFKSLTNDQSAQNLTDQKWKPFWLNIVERLISLNDLLALKAAHRIWRDIVDTMIQIKSLHVINEEHTTESIALNGIYIFTHESINATSLLFSAANPVQIFDRLHNELQLSTMLLKDLKQLSINRIIISSDSTLDAFQTMINAFPKLIQLQIQDFRIEIYQDSDEIVVPCLKFKRIQIFSVILSNLSHGLRLDAPIKKLCWRNSLSKIELENYSTVQHLDTDKFDESVHRYKNILYLHIREEVNVQLINFMESRRLREIRLQSCSKELFKSILSKKYEIVPSVMRLYLFDILMNSNDDVLKMFEANANLCRLDTRRLLKMYSKLANVTTQSEFNYSEYLVAWQNISYGFFSRFVNIQKVIIRSYIGVSFKVERCDEDYEDLVNGDLKKLKHFLHDCRVLNHLVIRDSNINQKFLDDLHVYAPFLVRLDLQLGFENRFTHARNIRFITRCVHLQELTVDFAFSFEEYLEVICPAQLKNIVFLLNNKITIIDFANLKIHISDFIYFVKYLPNDDTKTQLIKFIDSTRQIFQLALPRTGNIDPFQIAYNSDNDEMDS